jgi:hypothetical protein
MRSAFVHHRLAAGDVQDRIAAVEREHGDGRFRKATSRSSERSPGSAISHTIVSST